jgi:hypothetical protein
MEYDQIRLQIWLLIVMVICVANSQLAAIMMMVIYYHFKTMRQCGANKLGDVKNCGCTQIKNVAATLRNNQQQQDLAAPFEGYEVKQSLI